MTTKVIRAYSAETDPEEMARFEVRPDGTIVASYTNAGLRDSHERSGVYTARTGRVFPRDGRRFLDALELSLSHSSFWRLEDA